MNADLKALDALLRPQAREQGWTAELADENEPQGAVVLKDRNGNVRVIMPRQVYEELRDRGPQP